MSKDPAFLFYSKDFYTGVSTLSFEDRGKYISILCIMHQQGRLNEESIRLLVGSVSVKLKEKFLIASDGMWYNARLEEEIQKRNNFVDSRKKNGKMGGRPKPLAKPNGYPNAKPNGKPKDNLPVNGDVNENEINNKGAYADFEQAWFAYPGKKRNVVTEWQDFNQYADKPLEQAGQFLKAVEAYKIECEDKEQKYIKNMGNYIRDRDWEGIAPVKSVKPKKPDLRPEHNVGAKIDYSETERLIAERQNRKP